MLTGTGKSKKMAKKRADQEMLKKLQDLSISPSSSTPGLVDDDDKVCAKSRMELSLSVVLVIAVVLRESPHCSP
jgi:hypothetical protein